MTKTARLDQMADDFLAARGMTRAGSRKNTRMSKGPKRRPRAAAPIVGALAREVAAFSAERGSAWW